MSKQKDILFIQRSTPYSGHFAYESLEAILMAGVFDQRVSVLFMDDGVYQLCKHDAQKLHTRNVSKLCASFEMYDIDQLYVSEAALLQRGISHDSLVVKAKCLPSPEISGLIARNEIVVSS